MSKRLKQLLNQKKTMVLPGVFNAVTARLAQAAGFQALYVSGAGLANGVLAQPDIGLMTLSEVVQQVRYIASVVHIPILVDADTGFGGIPQVMRSVRELENAGASGIQIEDQIFPKRCGHLEGKELISEAEMAEKIRAAVAARKNKGFLVVARTDARGPEGLDGAIRRSRAYLKAGSDMIFPDALESREEFQKFSRKVRGLLMANMTEFGKTPYISVQEFRALGYHLVIFPMSLFRLMMKAAKDGLLEIKKTGSQRRLLSKMQTRKELYDLINYAGVK